MELRELAKKYIWWLPPEQAIRHPKRVIAQVMNLGTYSDWVALEQLYDDETLRGVLKDAKAGWFEPKRWNFWHIHLRCRDPKKVPPLPQRVLPRGALHE